MKMIKLFHPASLRSAVVMFGLYLLFSSAVRSDDDDAPASSTSTPKIDQSTNLQLADIKTDFARISRHAPEIIAFATVADLATLMMMRQQYLTSLAQADSAAAKYHESEQSLRRTQSLHQQDIVASKRLQEQQARWQADKADVASADLQKQAILTNNRLQWGEKLTQWFLQSDQRHIKGFLNGQQRLLNVNLPGEIAAGQAPDSIWVEAQGRRRFAVRANLIGIAPQADPLTLRQRAFYQVQVANLPAGSQLTAWFPATDQANNGVEIPENAVVWHLGQAIVFLKTATGAFERHVLNTFSPISDGLILTTDLHANAEVVTSGTQTLLSQELKKQIPSEDDD